MGPLIMFTLSYAVPMDRTSSLTILPSLLAGVSTFRASNVVTAMCRTLPSIEFLDFHSSRSLINLLLSKEGLKPQLILSVTKQQVLTASHQKSRRLTVRCFMPNVLLVCCWKQGKSPQDFRDAIIITLYMNMAEMSDSSIYR